MRKRGISAVAAIAGVIGGVLAVGLLSFLRACNVVVDVSPLDRRVARHFEAIIRRDGR